MSSASTKTKTATATAMARLYCSRHSLDTMYTRETWYKYNGNGLWRDMHPIEMSQEMWELLEEYEGKQECRPSKSAKDTVIDRTKARLFVPEELVDGNTNLINLQNGVYSLADSGLYPHKESYYFTTQLPFIYDASATCPMWQYYLMTTFVRPQSRDTDLELIEFVQEAMGYSLTTDVSHHVTFWCYGGGSNGKGVLFHVLEQLAGEAFFPLNVNILRRQTYQLAELPGKRIAACTEASATDNLVEDGTIKALIAGDTMPARPVYKQPFILHPTCKLWWSMNKLPAVADTSEGFWRRMRVIPFNRQFKKEEQMRDLKDKLDLELSGIFNWTMEGLRRLNNRGKFVEPNQVVGATQKYKEESNPVRMFVEDRCTVGTTHHIQSSVLYAAYRNWCSDNGHKPFSSVNFKRAMEALEHYSEKTDKFNVFVGIKLKFGVI